MQKAVVVLLLLSAAAHGRADDLRAGAAKVEITPPTGFPMWGYASRKDAPSTGVRDSLYARAVVLHIGDKKIGVVSLDLGRAPTRESMARVRKRLKEAAALEHLFVVASHTHHGPVLELDGWPKADKPYTRDLEDRLTRLLLDADKKVQPARLGIAKKEVELNHNRQSRLQEKPVDRELIVVRLEDERGQTIAHLVNFAAHPTILPDKLREFSPDYPGVMAALVEKEKGGLCLFLQGAAGDLSPTGPARATPEKFGEALGQEVLALSKSIEAKLEKPSGLQVRERSFVFAKRLELSNPVVRFALGKAFFPELIDFYEREYREGVRPQVTTALLDDRIALVGVSGEVFCSHALHLKKRARLEHLLFLGYCNDYHQYFPTIEAAAAGGYGTEVYIAPAEIGAGEKMMDRALIDLWEMRGRLK